MVDFFRIQPSTVLRFCSCTFLRQGSCSLVWSIWDRPHSQTGIMCGKRRTMETGNRPRSTPCCATLSIYASGILGMLFVFSFFYIFFLHFVTSVWCFFCSLGSPRAHLLVVGMLRFMSCLWHPPTELAHSCLFGSCICFCLCGPFNCISFHKCFRHLPTFWLCSFGLISALLALSAMHLLMLM